MFIIIIIIIIVPSQIDERSLAFRREEFSEHQGNIQ
jgi:hypothetical protein